MIIGFQKEIGRTDPLFDIACALEEAALKDELLAQYEKGLRSVAIVFIGGGFWWLFFWKCTYS